MAQSHRDQRLTGAGLLVALGIIYGDIGTSPLYTFEEIFTGPNRITPADFEGWVQDRNLYAFASFDPQYTPLLEAGDPNEPVNNGGELYARVGKGQYVYTAYAWFRQLPAGVPGAYRLFANLLSLGRTAP